jgi:hypothetical protein
MGVWIRDTAKAIADEIRRHCMGQYHNDLFHRAEVRENRPVNIAYARLLSEYLTLRERAWLDAVCARKPRVYERPSENEALQELAETVCRRMLADKHWRRRRVPEAAAPPSGLPLPTVVFATSQKRLKRLRAELRTAVPREANPEVNAFFARNVRPGGPISPKR